MQETINDCKSRYLEKYGYYPSFRAGMHSGHVLVTWVGEIKKEILYIGDVVNTTARIQEDCKRLNHDFLISEKIASSIVNPREFRIVFQEETVPRGRDKPVRLYSLEKEK